MRAYTQPLLVDGLGGPEQSCLALESVPLRQGAGGVAYDEGWLQRLIQSHPALLPVSDIEPGLQPLIPICMELPVPSGYVDNFMLTPEGGIVIVETKLWRNPEARREVVGQVLDYAKDLSAFTYEDLQAAARTACKDPALRLFDRVSAASEAVDEPRFIDAVSRNLRLGRLLMIIAGDGVQEGAEQLAGFLQRHVGLHFTLALVELSLWRTPGDDRVLVQPRILARTVQIERAVVRVESGVSLTPVSIQPVAATTSRATTLTETQFYESLARVSPDLPTRLTAFLEETRDLGVVADVRRNFSLKWQGPDGQGYHLGSVSLEGKVDTTYCNWYVDMIGRLDLPRAYFAEVAGLLRGGKVRETPSPSSWRVVTERGEPELAELLDRHAEWAGAIGRYIEALGQALRERQEG